MKLNFRIADKNDSEEIANLVNKAYRPGKNNAGWTHESNLLAGERISAEQVASLFCDKSNVLLLCTDSKIVACVHVQGGDLNAYIGMLATDPAMQAKGVGKQMLKHAERYAAEAFGNSVFKMSVLSFRPELLDFYERRGYTPTGEIESFPVSAGVGEPIIDGIQILSLIKHSHTCNEKITSSPQ